jgi:hypothetical protein
MIPKALNDLGFLKLNLNGHMLKVQIDRKDTKRKGLRWKNTYKKVGFTNNNC